MNRIFRIPKATDLNRFLDQIRDRVFESLLDSDNSGFGFVPLDAARPQTIPRGCQAADMGNRSESLRVIHVRQSRDRRQDPTRQAGCRRRPLEATAP
ncbi:MAG: hypothetical protein NDI61_02410 [Bdellovibrionaceae bacterium]|nr:hypothetical protein [Pseudobdellovibrionaceae bacterium]